MTKTWGMPLTLLAVVLLLVPGAQADPITELFFSEYLEGSSNNKALEIFNGTDAAVDLAASGYAVQMYFNGNSLAGLTLSLHGTVVPGDVFVLAHSGASATILARADQLSGSTFFNGDDAIALVRGGVILDVIGQIGVDPGTAWGSALASTADATLRRRGTVTTGDPDGSDPFDPALEWDSFPIDTIDGLGAHSVAGVPVAEPPAVVVLVGALGALAAVRRRRRHEVSASTGGTSTASSPPPARPGPTRGWPSP